MLPTGRTFKALTGFRRALVPDTLQVWGKKEAAARTRQIKKWGRRGWEKKKYFIRVCSASSARLWRRQPFQCRFTPILTKIHVFVEEATTDTEMPIVGVTDNILSSSATPVY